MQYKTLGKTGIKISEIGYGAWGIGGGLWQGSDDKESMQSLLKAAEQGVTFFDTALAYGDGHSERLIGKFQKEWGDSISVATKIPPLNQKWPAEKGIKISDVFPAEYITKCTEESLRNLDVDALHVQQFHVWDDDWADESEWYETICSLKEQGKILHFGVSINDHQPDNALRLIECGRVETVQVIYNIFDQSPEDNLFPACKQHNVGVIVRVPLDEGGLTGTITPETVFPEKDFRNKYFRGDRKRQVYERTKALNALLGEEASSLPELALRFCLHHPAVSTLIPGMRSTSHVDANCAASDGRSLSEELLEELKKHRWQRVFYH